MSYKHLAGRLIETQRSMLGEPAIDIARSTEGITVTDDGNVAAVDGDARAAVDELARRYTEMLGGAAENRLVAAAREFEDELALPPSLGGREFETGHRDPAVHDPSGSGSVADAPTDGDPPTASTDGDPPTPEPGASDSTAAPARSPGAVSDGGTVEVRTGAGSGSDRTATRVVSPTTTGPGEVVSPTPGTAERDGSESASDELAADEAGGDDGPAGETGADAAPTDDATGRGGRSLSEPVTVEYTVASTVPPGERADADLASVYLMPGDDGGFQTPVAVEDAVAGAVTDATDLGREDLDEFVGDIDTERLLATLDGENGETVSFPLRTAGLTVTFHRSGSLAVH